METVYPQASLSIVGASRRLRDVWARARAGGVYMSRDDASYYRQRAVDHRAMALAAGRQNVREIHEELAHQYDALVEQAELRSALRIQWPDAEGKR